MKTAAISTKSKNSDAPNSHSECGQFVLPIRDTLDIISGKWKLPIMGALMMGKKRFKEMEREIPNITARMLSKELKELEVNQLVKRTVYSTMPVSVEYELTPYGKTLDKVLLALKEWGVEHRKKIMKPLNPLPDQRYGMKQKGTLKKTNPKKSFA